MGQRMPEAASICRFDGIQANYCSIASRIFLEELWVVNNDIEKPFYSLDQLECRYQFFPSNKSPLSFSIL